MKKPPPSTTWFDENRLPLPLQLPEQAGLWSAPGSFSWWVCFTTFARAPLELFQVPHVGTIGISAAGKLYLEAAHQEGVRSIEWFCPLRRDVWYRLELAWGSMPELLGFNVYTRGTDRPRAFTIFVPEVGRAVVSRRKD